MHQAPRTNLNLLPASYRRRTTIRAAVTVWAGVWLVGIPIMGGAWWQVRNSGAEVDEEISKLGRTYAPALAMKQEIEAIEQRLAAVKIEEKAAAGLEDRRTPLTLLAILSKASKACEQRLHVRECVVKRTPAREAGIPDSQILTIKGAALDLLCVTRFHAVLRDAAIFHRVELKPTTSEPIHELDGYAFHVECLY